MQMIKHTRNYLFKQIVTKCKSTTYYILSTCRDCLICLVAAARGGKTEQFHGVSTEISTFINTYSWLWMYKYHL